MSKQVHGGRTILLGAVLIAVVSWTANAMADTLAYWTFDGTDDAFLADSSGHEHVLSNTGASRSTDAAVGLGSASFNGSAIMQTVGKLDLSPYKSVTVSWWQKSSSTTDGILCEHTPDSSTQNFGGFYIYNPDNAKGEVMLRGANNGTAPPVYMDDYTSTATSDWVRMSVTINLAAASASDVIRMQRNGQPVGTDTHTKSLPDAFANDYFYIGARSGAMYGYTGQIDDLKIETTLPEPSTLVLLALGCISLLAYAWKERHPLV